MAVSDAMEVWSCVVLEDWRLKEMWFLLALGEHEREGKERFWSGPLGNGAALVDCAFLMRELQYGVIRSR